MPDPLPIIFTTMTPFQVEPFYPVEELLRTPKRKKVVIPKTHVRFSPNLSIIEEEPTLEDIEN